jgi:pyruvate dehydrogenase E2 component (dihydrolipoamide acetyltransferase)
VSAEDQLISNIVIPNLGATGGPVVFEGWLIELNGFVKAGAPLFVVTTDKATVEVEAFMSGYVRRTIAASGDLLEPGAVIGILSGAIDESIDDVLQVSREKPTDFESRITKSEFVSGASGQSRDSQRIVASPLARRIAKEAGIDLAGIAGTGKRGAILRRDVEMNLIEPYSSGKGILPGPAPKRGDRIPLSGMRRAIAQRTQASKSQIPHFYAAITIDMESARAFLEDAVKYATQNGWQPPKLNDLVLRATALALSKFPQINASLEEEEILFHKDINVGLAVGLEDGLIIPVIHRADEKNLYSLAAWTNVIIEKARQQQLSGTDLAGGTFTVSNLGMYGLDNFTAVINPPEAGVLAVGAVRQVPAVSAGQLVPRWQMEVTLSVDHRIVDGVIAARFLEELRQNLETPARLALEAPEGVS